jgi:hypothetical protein
MHAWQSTMLALHDDTHWPVVVVRMPSGSMTTGEFDVHLQHLARYLKRGEAHALVIDIGESDLLGVNRQQLTEHQRVHAAAVREHLRAVAVVVRAPIHRAMYTAVHDLLESPYPLRRFDSLADAEAWAGRVVARARASEHPA